MKTCPKCGKEYPDFENFCIDCGSKLEAAERHEEAHSGLSAEIERLSAQMARLKKEFEGRHEEVSGAASTGISKLTGRLGTLEKRIYKQPEPAANEELVSLASSVGELEKRMDELEKSVSEVRVPESLEAKIAQLEKQVARAGKEALRVAKAKHMPDSEAMGIVSGMGELEQRLDDVEIKLGEFPKPEELDLSPMEKRINALEKKINSMNSGLKSFVSVLKDNESTHAALESGMHAFVKHGDMTELRKVMFAEDEKIALKLDEMSSLKKDMEKSVARIEKSVISELDARITEKLKPIENFREKVMVIAGLAMEQQEKFKQLKSSTTEMVNRRIMQSEAALSKQLEQMKSKTDNSAALSIGATESLKSKMDSDMASLNESISHLEEFENRIGGELEVLKGSSASRHDIEAIKELAESYNARLSTFKQMLASHSMTLGELSQARAQMQSEQEHAIDNMNSRISEAVQGVRTQGNSIVADMEKKMNDSISAGLRSIEETRSRMEGEMKLVLDTLSRSQGFDKAVQSELAALKAEVGELDGRIKAAVSEEKGALDNAIKSELKKLQKTSRDAEQKLGLLKDSWDRAIKDTVRKSADEFEEVRKSYSESIEKAKNIESYASSLVDKAMREINKKTGEEGRMNASLRKELENALKEARITNKDSQEKLAMVKDFITNIESRFGSDIDGLNRRMDKLAKIQQKLELEGISPGRRVK